MSLTPRDYYEKSQKITDKITEIAQEISALPDLAQATVESSDQICEGYTAWTKDGTLISGTYTPKIVRVEGQYVGTPQNTYGFSETNQKIVYPYPDPMFDYDYVFCTARSRTMVQSTSDLTRTYIITSWVIHDKRNGWLSYKDFKHDSGWANYLLDGTGYERGYMNTCLDTSIGSSGYENYYAINRITEEGIVSFHDVGGAYALDGETTVSKGAGGVFDYAFALYVKL